MLHILNKNIRIQIILLTLLAIWSGFTVFTQMTFDTPEGKMLLFQQLLTFAQGNPMIVRIFAFLIVMVSTFGINRHFNRQRYEEFTTMMPGIFFLLVMNCGHFIDIFTPALISILFLSIVMMVFVPGTPPAKMKGKILSLGILIAIATLIDFSAFGIVLLLLFIIGTNSVSPVKDSVILLAGLMLPYIYAFSIAYLCNSMPVFVQSWRQLQFFTPLKTITGLRVIDYVCVAYMFVAIIIFWIRGRNYFENKLIILRQAFNSIHLQFISMAIFLTLGSGSLMIVLSYIAPILSEYMSIAIAKKRYKYVYDIIIVALLVLLWL